MIYKSQEELDQVLAEWQKILRLQDWRITASILRERDMTKPGRAGEIEIFHEYKKAIIYLCDPLDFSQRDARWSQQDHEQSLVHELVHVHVEGVIVHLELEDIRKIPEERCVDFLAEALVMLKRSGANIAPLFCPNCGVPAK